MPYASGGEAASGNAKIEAVKLQHVAARVIGEFGWSIYQRAYDGVRVDTALRRWTATAFALHPTQGGFEDAAGLMMPRVPLLCRPPTINSAPPPPSGPYQGVPDPQPDTPAV